MNSYHPVRIGNASFAPGTHAWIDLLGDIMANGEIVSPRGKRTRELLHTRSTCVRMDQAMVAMPDRRLNYKFQCAEALWILGGDNRLAPLTKHVKRMADFSDDGVTLAGAYGPRINPQLDYVVNALVKDRDTRQAVLTIWTPNPAPSKDIPCTVAMAFSIRENHLYQHVYMRSSDAWLGVPYDMFSFAAVGLKVACLYNAMTKVLQAEGALEPVWPGGLTITATSAHLYSENDSEAARLVSKYWAEPIANPPGTPHELVIAGRWDLLQQDLELQEAGMEPANGWKVTL